LDAVRALGLGTTTYSSYLMAVAQALAAWDVEPELGQVAQHIGLRVPQPATKEKLKDVWSAAVASPQSDAVVTLDKAFAYRAPDTKVLAALRQVYLWWGLDPHHILGRSAEKEPAEERAAADISHFLDGGLDFTDADLQHLVRTLRGAYPKPEDIQSLASRAGLNMGNVNWRQTPGGVVREVLEEADRSDRLVPLLGQALTDPNTLPFHAEIRDVVGSDWLNRQGIGDEDVPSSAEVRPPQRRRQRSFVIRLAGMWAAGLAATAVLVVVGAVALSYLGAPSVSWRLNAAPPQAAGVLLAAVAAVAAAAAVFPLLARSRRRVRSSSRQETAVTPDVRAVPDTSRPDALGVRDTGQEPTHTVRFEPHPGVAITMMKEVLP
jgi:Effector-associated domain 1